METLATGLHHPLGLAAAADHLIVATDDGLVTVSLATGTVAPLADAHAPVPDAHAPLHVALAGDALAWTEATGRLVLHLAGRSHPLPSGGRPSSLTLSAHHLYWLDLEAGAIRRTRLR